MKKMNMYEAPKADVIEMQMTMILMSSGEGPTGTNPTIVNPGSGDSPE